MNGDGDIPSTDHDDAATPSPAESRLRVHALPLLLASLSILFALIGAPATHWLRYDRPAILDGQWWRLLSGNMVHLGWQHLLLNLAGLLLVWMLFRHTLSTRRWLLVTAVSASTIGGGLLMFDPELEWYVGLSGVLHGLFAAGLVTALFAGNRAEWLLLIFFVAKITWEQLVGTMPGTAEIAGGNVIVDAHLYGAIGGAVTALLLALANRRHEH